MSKGGAESQDPNHPLYYTDSTAISVATSPTYYTLLIICPDYPYRCPTYVDHEQPDRGFFIHFMVANLPSAAIDSSPLHYSNDEQHKRNTLSSSSTRCAYQVHHTRDLAKKGDVVIPYIPPLPTEDAGTSRILCVLYAQTHGKVHITPLSP
uniref:Putative odorant-binding protein A5 n=1 Tax=Lygus hesperus TaxID=30085 RepID=A0A0A9VXM5_LYGHE